VNIDVRRSLGKVGSKLGSKMDITHAHKGQTPWVRARVDFNNVCP